MTWRRYLLRSDVLRNAGTFIDSFEARRPKACTEIVQGHHRPERNVGFASQGRPHAGRGLYQRRGRDGFRQRLIIAARLRSREPRSAFRTWIAHGSLTSQVKQGCFR